MTPRRRRLIQWGSVAGVVTTWEAAVRGALLDPTFVPAPTAVARANQVSGPLLSADGTINAEAIEVMQTTLVDLRVQKQRVPTTDLYTTEFTPVRV